MRHIKRINEGSWKTPGESAYVSFDVEFNPRNPETTSMETTEWPWYLFLRRKAAPGELWLLHSDFVIDHPDFRSYYVTNPKRYQVSEFVVFADHLYHGLEGLKVDGPRYATSDADVKKAIDNDFQDTTLVRLSPETAGYLADHILKHPDHMLSFSDDPFFFQLVNTLAFLRSYYGDKLPPLENQEKYQKLMKTFDALKWYSKAKKFL